MNISQDCLYLQGVMLCKALPLASQFDNTQDEAGPETQLMSSYATFLCIIFLL